MEIEGQDDKPLAVWQRTPREERIDLVLKGDGEQVTLHVPGSKELKLHAVERGVSAEELREHIPAGKRSGSVLPVNHRVPNKENPDLAYAFQPELDVRGDEPFVPRTDPRRKPSPISLENCPWCGERFQPDSFTLLPGRYTVAFCNNLCAHR